MRENWCCMRGSSQQVLQHAFDRFSAACDQEGTKTNSKKFEVLCLAQGSVSWTDAQGSVSCADAQGSVFCEYAAIQCSRWRRSSTLGWYQRVMKVGTKGLIHGLVKNAVLRELCCSVMIKRGLSKNAKLSVFKSVFVPILTCGHES